MTVKVGRRKLLGYPQKGVFMTYALHIYLDKAHVYP